MNTRRLVPSSQFVAVAAFLVGFGVTCVVRYSGATVSALPLQGTLPLVQQQDLAYVGAFRPPAKPSGVVDADSLAYGGTVLTYNPLRDSLYLVGYTTAAKVAEITIPAARVASTISGLERATYLQPLTDILAGKRLTVDGGIGNGVYLGGLLPVGNSLIVSAYTYYDGNGTQSLSHFKTGTDFGNLGTVTGPVEIKTSLRDPGAGFVAGYMVDIPTHWQAALGGVALTGQGALAIVSRTSYGPSLSVFNPADVSKGGTVSSTPVLGYPQAHTTLGDYGPVGSTAFFNGNMHLGGVIFPPGTSSVLFWGRRGSRFCYGAGTSDPALDLKPVPNVTNLIYCYDPTDSSKGTHGYPYEQFVAAYDANDLVRVKNGQKKPWEIVPYAKWTFALPFETGSRLIDGVTYDPATRRVFVSAGKQEGSYPIIHVFTLNAGSSGPTGNRLCY